MTVRPWLAPVILHDHAGIRRAMITEDPCRFRVPNPARRNRIRGPRRPLDYPGMLQAAPHNHAEDGRGTQVK